MFTSFDVSSIIKSLSSTSRMSLRRVIKVAYLLDWHMAFKMGIASDHQWMYGACGPSDVSLEMMIRTDSEMLELREVDNHYGGKKLIVCCQNVPVQEEVGNHNLAIAIGNVRSQLYDISWAELSQIVASTYPMSKYHPGDIFDLQESAREYKELLMRRGKWVENTSEVRI